MINTIIADISAKMPSVIRWAGAIASELRKHNVSLTNKSSGYATTDALTLADLTVQELVVAALRDHVPSSRQLRIEAEEANGALTAFATESEYVIALDPIDGTKQFRDHSGDGWAIMLHIRNVTSVIYSLVLTPAMGEQGTWLEAGPNGIRCGLDDWSRSAEEVIASFPVVTKENIAASENIYMINFMKDDPIKASLVNETGLKAFLPDDMPGSIYPLMAQGRFGGSLIHTPNIYDYPVSLHLARLLGGESVWVHNGEPVNFRTTWMDERAGMLRLPGVIATAINKEHLDKLVRVAKDWDQRRYRD
ncbi:inositol monophosphatase family protein [Lacunimicrobium album]